MSRRGNKRNPSQMSKRRKDDAHSVNTAMGFLPVGMLQTMRSSTSLTSANMTAQSKKIAKLLAAFEEIENKDAMVSEKLVT